MKQLACLVILALAIDVAPRSSAFLQAQKALAVADDVPPISTTMQCVINLSVQYFIVYTALAFVRCVNTFLDEDKKWKVAEKRLKFSTLTVHFAPMLAVLFLGVRMRANLLSEGETEKYGLPQWWAQWAMQCCAWSLVAQTIMVLIMETKVSEDGTPEAAGNKDDKSMVPKILSAVRYTAMALMYGGFTTVCVAGILMEAPADGSKAPPVSAAVECTMNLSLQFFAVYLAINVMATYHDFWAPTDTSTKIQEVFKLCVETVNFAPMLCILFIGARIRALQLNLWNGNPQPWAETAFYLCAYSVLVQLFFVLLTLVVGGKAEKGKKGTPEEGDVVFEFENTTLHTVATVCRFAAMLCLYAGFTVVIYSINVITAPNGAPTPPVSPAMQCVMNLTMQFFFVYLFFWLFLAVKKYTPTNSFVDIAIPTLEAAKETTVFCPMLSILFLGTRMRALQITDNQGAPQGWAQQGMFLATYALAVQVCMVFLMPSFTGEAPKMDTDGIAEAPAPGKTNPGLLYIVHTLRWLAFICLYAGTTTVVVSLFLITPETAIGEGTLIPGVQVPAPVGIAGF